MRGLLCYALGGLCLASPALADGAAGGMPNAEDVANRDIVTVALGPAWVPDYEGSNDYRIVPGAALRGRYHGIAFTTQGQYLYVDFVPQSGKLDLDLGPLAGFRMSTRKKIKDDVVELLPHRNHAIEVGAFAGVSLHGLTNPYDTLALHVDVAHDIGNAHKSTVITPNFIFSTPLSTRTYASLSGGIDFASNRYADYYFSVTPADSIATGGVLSPFDAGGGMKDWKLGLTLAQSVTGDLLGGLSVFGYAQYARLVGDFRRSPLVSQRGSAGQWTLSAGLAYTWSSKR